MEEEEEEEREEKSQRRQRHVCVANRKSYIKFVSVAGWGVFGGRGGIHTQKNSSRKKIENFREKRGREDKKK